MRKVLLLGAVLIAGVFATPTSAYNGTDARRAILKFERHLFARSDMGPVTVRGCHRHSATVIHCKVWMPTIQCRWWDRTRRRHDGSTFVFPLFRTTLNCEQGRGV